ncbi:MAG TPA: cytochrome c [Steroidobacteraceae bacterium]|nr:cytochrome c [Steroidobacteraceae bacterium]
MKRLLWIVAVIVVVGAAVSALAFSRSVPHRPDVTATPEMVQRGEALVRAGDCISCHTVPGQPAYAGGREFDLGSMGKLYSPNITPDRETGIGAWSDDDFRAAMQLGVAKGGVHLYPAFPYASFTLLSDDDVLAIKAYLFSLKPVHSIPPQDAMVFPYNQRWLMAYWGWLFDSNKRLASDPQQSADWNRGRYLVEALGHCQECHTPRNFLQGLKRSEAYAGAVQQKWKAYDISSDKESGIGNWTDEALEAYLATGFAPDHGPAGGPMAEAISNSLHYLPTQDIHAMVVYLRTVKPVASAVPTRAAATAGGHDAQLALGRQVYARECANCHRRNGEGTQSPDEALKGDDTVADPQAINLTQVVLYGSTLDTANGRVNMLGFGRGLTNAEVAAVVNYTGQTLAGHSADLTPEEVAARR